MSFKDLRDRFVGALSGSGIFGQREQPESNLGNGGSSGYFPGAKNRAKEKTENQYTQSYPAGMEGYPQQGGYTQQFTQQQPNMSYTQQFTQQQPMNTGYTQQFTQQQGMGYTQQFQQQGNTGYTQQFTQQGTGYAPYQQMPYGQQESYAAPQQGGYNAPQQNGWQQPQSAYNAPPQQNGWQPPQQQQTPPDNISYMPGNFVDDNGRAYVHVERVTQLVSFQACYRIIEFMKNGESIILNTESVPSEAEIIRCIDMLSGAAYTLGCSLTKITATKRAYLIAPSTVQVTADVSIRRMSDRRTEEGGRRRARSYAESDGMGYEQPAYETAGDYEAEPYQQQAAGQGYAAPRQSGYEAPYRGQENQGTSFGRYGGFGGR